MLLLAPKRKSRSRSAKIGGPVAQQIFTAVLLEYFYYSECVAKEYGLQGLVIFPASL